MCSSTGASKRVENNAFLVVDHADEISDQAARFRVREDNPMLRATLNKSLH